jgi:hypothetical protein
MFILLLVFYESIFSIETVVFWTRATEGSSVPEREARPENHSVLLLFQTCCEIKASRYPIIFNPKVFVDFSYMFLKN